MMIYTAYIPDARYHKQTYHVTDILSCSRIKSNVYMPHAYPYTLI